MKLKLTCRDCGRSFDEKPDNAPGYRNQCGTCSLTQEEPPLIGGNMIYEHKTGAYLELKPLAMAKAFARRTRRVGATVCSSLVEKKEPRPEEYTTSETQSRGDKQDRGRRRKD